MTPKASFYESRLRDCLVRSASAQTIELQSLWRTMANSYLALLELDTALNEDGSANPDARVPAK